MIKEPRISLFDLIMCLSNIIGLVDGKFHNHHKRTAYIAACIASEMGLSPGEKNAVLLSGLVHDCGALSMQDGIDLLEFDNGNSKKHSEAGYLILKDHKFFSDLAYLIRDHHIYWKDIKDKESVDVGSNILHLADRVAGMINEEEEVLGQSGHILDWVKEQSGSMFQPEVADTFEKLFYKEYFWFDLMSADLSSILRNESCVTTVILNLEDLLDFGKLVCQIIDFRSRFTATHSSGVAATAEELARLAGLSERECMMMRAAGYLHDAGKLIIPKEILEKPAGLSVPEYNIIKSHSYYTYYSLHDFSELRTLTEWAAFHHERLNGKGYPFHHSEKDLVLGSRIMAVSDVFTALTEDRPYRKKIDKAETLRILEQMSKAKELDSGVVSMLKHHWDSVNSVCASSRGSALEEYKEFELEWN